jgi:hypothetical protein
VLEPADHVAPVFESLCREWVRRDRGEKVSNVGSWWDRQAAERVDDGLTAAAARDPRITLVSLDELVASL